MSTQPEEDEIEIEEGEIVTEDEDDEELTMTDDDDEEDDEELFEDNEVDVPTLMTSLLATEDGDTICTALVNIGLQLQTQNKILIKMLSQMKN